MVRQFAILLVEHILDETPNHIRMGGNQMVIGLYEYNTASKIAIEQFIRASEFVAHRESVNVTALSPMEFKAEFEHFTRGVRIVPIGYLLGFKRMVE